ncbi:HpcH/HpaI aldolase family protein [Nocardioides marmoriginsengisoli]|uniref:HpcH/HpaI aldolase family protein n=1 Tax=Nocardioides marmoriginsengisoli TaxID=661483 RepID=UPI0016182775|nr:aldolase/citrate lyase family protein [Nocardioides marmoriginsengisoli]
MTPSVRLRERARSGVAFGAWCSLPSSSIVEFACAADPDYFCIDLQHGVVDMGAAISMLQTASRFDATPVIRVANLEAAGIGRALDMGAEAVIVPGVNTRAEAAAAVAACRYAPEGVRSYGPTRAGQLFGNSVSDLEEHALCIAMIETADGLANAESICATPGLAGIYVGPADLALGLGANPVDPSEQAVTDALVHIVDLCGRNDLIAGIHAYESARANEYVEMGFRMVTCAMDTRVLAAGFAAEFGRMRELRSSNSAPGNG